MNARLHRHVEVPQVVMDCLVDPLLLAGAGVERQDRRLYSVIERVRLAAPQVTEELPIGMNTVLDRRRRTTSLPTRSACCA
jgi:hypothetical protein